MDDELDEDHQHSSPEDSKESYKQETSTNHQESVEGGRSTDEVIASQGAISFAGNIIERGVGFIFVVLVARMVTPSDYGAFTLSLTIIVLVRGAAGLSLDRSVDYFVPQKLGKPDEIWSILKRSIGASTFGATLTGLSVWAASPMIAQRLGEPRLAGALPILALALPLWVILDITSSFFRSIKRIPFLVYSRRMAYPISKLILTIGFIVIGWEFYGLIGGYVIAVGIGVITAFGLLVVSLDFSSTHKVSREHSNENISLETPTLRKMISYSLPLVFAGTIYTIVYQIDYLIIGYFLTSAEVGKYRIAYLLTSNLVIVIGSLSSIYKPLAAEHAKDDETLREIYYMTTRWGVLLTVPMVVILLSAPQTFLEVLFTDRFAAAGAVVSVMTLGFLANAVGGPEAMMLEGLGHTRLSLFNAALLILVSELERAFTED